MALSKTEDHGKCPNCTAKETCRDCVSDRRARLADMGFIVDSLYKFRRPRDGGYAVLANGTPIAWFDDESSAVYASKAWASNWIAVAGKTLSVAKG
jgi:hypothetical protein